MRRSLDERLPTQATKMNGPGGLVGAPPDEAERSGLLALRFNAKMRGDLSLDISSELDTEEFGDLLDEDSIPLGQAGSQSADLRRDPSALAKSSSRRRVHGRLTVMQMATLSAYWFGFSSLWMPLTVLILPRQVSQMSTESKGSTLGAILCAGALSSLVSAPIAGKLSDMSRHTGGRRRPFMKKGCIVVTICLLIMATSPPMLVYVLSFITLSIASNVIMTPYCALVPDVVAEDQRGVVSGWLGGAAMLGNLVGGVVGYGLQSNGVVLTYFLLILLHGCALAITVTFVEEQSQHYIPPASSFGIHTCCSGLLKPFYGHDFRWLFLSRFLVQMGTSTVQENLLFYLQDAIRSFTVFGSEVTGSPDQALSVVSVPLLVGAIGTSAVAGIVSDRIGERKRIVYWSGGIMAGACIMFSIMRSFTACLFISAIYGMGFGAFSAVDWAMATDILPNAEEFAKDMGVWSLAVVLPNVLLPLSGYVLDWFESADTSSGYNLGYTAVLLLAGLYYISGTYCVRFIRAVR